MLELTYYAQNNASMEDLANIPAELPAYQIFLPLILSNFPTGHGVEGLGTKLVPTWFFMTTAHFITVPAA